MTAPRVWFPGAFANDNFLSLVAAPRAAGFEKDALTDDAQGKLWVADSPGSAEILAYAYPG